MNIDTPHTSRHALNWVGGEWVGSDTIRGSINPATYEVIGTYAEGGVETAEAAIVAAKRAMRATDWVHDRKLRARVLDNLADAFERNRGELIKILCTENGKIQREASFEVDLCAPSLRYFAGIVRTDAGRVVDSKPGRIALMMRQPMGVAGVIVPWNSPIILTVRSLAPALAAGCAVIIKVPGKSAQIAATLSKIFANITDLPRGVINVFTDETGDGAKHLVASPEVPVISFTGSTATGKAIALSAAPHFKRIGLELGGKTPSIIFNDTDLDLALPVLQTSVTMFAGQFCVTGQRVIVQEGIADEFRKRFAERLRTVQVGPASDLSSEMGPMIDRENVERVDKAVERAIADGAEVIVRGGPVTEGPLSKGAFFRPTFLEVTDPTMPVVQEETFGPVVTMQRFTTEQQAVALANDSIYGLGASIWTRDLSKALRIAPRIEAGMVWINEWGALGEDTEEGGAKQSGLGRLNGVAALDDFTEIRTITLNPGLMNA
ncbi:aldehyde dehydrogenase family protein [Pseudomonas sp. R-28-1W-6]|uniref:aldehyde dehydrogenase family protein n=1 Tax=Pseudomonas sp. R-28-1W-6 TaxID=2650101 RepID=UPI0013653E3D|nr:aldehyde dehydrogenase family protein [Pseudomonas sp. R-28-1W-6]MWV12425.1 aldehyde dehydrogenase family protein [Pseudomonas sp. R-28-1W-6]